VSIGYLLYEEARVPDGDKPLGAKTFAACMGRVADRTLARA
jgi:hypothetical protein